MANISDSVWQCNIITQLTIPSEFTTDVILNEIQYFKLHKDIVAAGRCYWLLLDCTVIILSSSPR